MFREFLTFAAISLAVIGFNAPARGEATHWQSIASDQGRSIEIDNATLKREKDGTFLVTSRLILTHELVDTQSGGDYKYIQTTNRYDCEHRTVATLRRSFIKTSFEVLREDEIKDAPPFPVRSNTLEEKVLKEVCRPPGSSGNYNNPPPQPAQTGKPSVLTKTPANANPPTPAGQNASAGQTVMTINASDRSRLRAQLEAIKAAAANLPPPETHAAPAGQTPQQPAYSGSAQKPQNVAKMAAIPPAVRHNGASANTPPAPPVIENPLFSKAYAQSPLCQKGQRQSPINIQNGIKVDLDAIQFDYHPSLFSVLDTGTGIETRVLGSGIKLMGKRYELERILFQRPAEERLEGRVFAMGAHLEHIAADGERLIVAVLMEKGVENPVIQTLWNYLPLEKYQEIKPPEAVIDPSHFLPQSRSYHTYMGSLTRPPCTEGIIWVVLKTPIQISPEQEAIFAHLYPNNARPEQPAHGRLIKSSRD